MKKSLEELNNSLVDWAVENGKVVFMKVKEDKAKDNKNPKSGLFLLRTPKLPKI